MQRNYTLDFYRLLGAFCVVILHSPLGALPNTVALALRIGSRWAVPFFFLVSGYLVAQKMQAARLSVTGSINKLLAIFIVANLVYIIFYLLDGDSSTNVKLTLVGLLIGQIGHLWFIGSSVFGLLVLQYIVMRYSVRTTLLIAIAVFLLVLAGDSYRQLSRITLQYEAARYLTSIPFLAGGYLLAKRVQLVQRIPVAGYVVAIAAGLALQFVEAYALYKYTGISPHNNELMLGTALTALSIIGLSLRVETADNYFAHAGRIYSLLIYLYHPLIIALLFGLLSHFPGSTWANYVSPVLVFGVLYALLKLLHTYAPRVFGILSGQ